MNPKELIQIHANQLELAIRQNKPEAIFTWKLMFGGAAYYADGQVFAAWYQDERLLLKLAESDGAALRNLGGEAGPVQMSRLYTYLPLNIQNDESELALWVAKSLSYIASLPKKKPKK